jgi:hypothetical protein
MDDLCSLADHGPQVTVVGCLLRVSSLERVKAALGKVFANGFAYEKLILDDQYGMLVKATWDTPARIDGLPATNWKMREGVTLAGTLADCIARWLRLRGHQQRDCTLGGGPLDGRYGTMSPPALASYVR